MKKLLTCITLSLLVLGTSQVQAQNADADVTLTRVIEASVDEVWSLLRQMDDIQNYSSMIATVEWTGDHGIGGERKCLPPEGGSGYFKERIVSFSDEQRTYSYALIEGVPAKGMVNRFKVVDLGYNKSMIVWTSSYEQFMPNPQMNEEQFLAFLHQSVSEMIDNVSLTALRM
ncbi:MAG TPA: SRPBCC family protein [Cytophagales bacterium]|nr:SRPBCC family protein [Cytophagales bacterium]HAA22573.1 SRPBCC family protein [Cytophagales bacterium]HAP64713.1 SRPBCC family protein [Cytophagales bacterium]